MAVRPIDGDALRKELTCNFAGEPFHGNRKVTIGEVRRIIESMPTLTPTTIGHCKDCDNWNEQFSAGRKSLFYSIRRTDLFTALNILLEMH